MSAALDGVLDIASWVLLVTGGFFAVVGGLGLLRMPEFYTRVHAASVTDTLASGFILAGLLLQAESVLVAVKLVVIGLLIFFTSPAATHALTKAALGRGLEPLLHGGEAKSKR